jgi:hypothetical protein
MKTCTLFSLILLFNVFFSEYTLAQSQTECDYQYFFLPTKLEASGQVYQPVFKKPDDTGNLSNIAYSTHTYPYYCYAVEAGHPDFVGSDPCEDNWRVPSTWTVSFIDDFSPTNGVIASACAEANPNLITSAAPTIQGTSSLDNEFLATMPYPVDQLTAQELSDAYFSVIEEIFLETELTSPFQITFMFRNWSLISGEFLEDPLYDAWAVAITSSNIYDDNCEPPPSANDTHNGGNIVINTAQLDHTLLDIYQGGTVNFQMLCVHELLHIIGLSHPEGGIEDPIPNDTQIPILSALNSDCSGLSNQDFCVQNRSIDQCMRDAITCLYDGRNCQECGNIEFSLSPVNRQNDNITFTWLQEDMNLEILGFNIYRKIGNQYQSLNKSTIKPATGDQPEEFTFSVAGYPPLLNETYFLEVVQPNRKHLFKF